MQVEMEQVEGRRFRIRARGVEVIVDDTVEAGGPGDGFRPTELLMGALAACMAGTMVTFADRQGIEIRVTVDRRRGRSREEPKSDRASQHRHARGRRGGRSPGGRARAGCLGVQDPQHVDEVVRNGARVLGAYVTALVSPEWLAGRLDDPSLTILEVSFYRPDRAAWFHGHIPGSHYVYWKDFCWDDTERRFPDSEVMSARLGPVGCR